MRGDVVIASLAAARAACLDVGERAARLHNTAHALRAWVAAIEDQLVQVRAIHHDMAVAAVATDALIAPASHICEVAVSVLETMQPRSSDEEIRDALSELITAMEGHVAALAQLQVTLDSLTVN